MLLNNLMEDKRLNFDQPLLSVRRHSPLATSQRSDKTKIDKSRPLIPHLPPHRSELKSGPIRNPGAVPFLWEQSPGQPKEESKPQTRNFNNPPIAPKLPPGRYVKADPQDCHKVDENVRERSKETVEERESSDSGDSGSAYVDALDTLSRAESSFLNCSMSGLDDSNVELSGSFSSNVQAREFMMDRFLPAAKAMASETPQYSPKKQPVVQQQVKKMVTQYKPSLRYGPSFAARYSHYHKSEEESDEEYDQTPNLPSVCGLLPRFCLKSSLCVLNPLHAMSVRTRVPDSSRKVQPRSSSVGSYSEIEIESRLDRTEVKPMDKIQRDELDEDNAKWRNESGRLESLSSSTYRDSSLLFLEEREGISIRKENGTGFKTFQELLDDQEWQSGDPIIERTLYVDTERKVECFGNRDLSLVSTTKEAVKEATVTEREAMECVEKQLVSQAATLGNSHQNYNDLPAPPALPKSPSDSWLSRTLPSMPAKSSSLRLYIGKANLEKQCKKRPTSEMKWETIVKTTKETLTIIPET